MNIDYDVLHQFATSDPQHALIDGVKKFGTPTQAAPSLGISGRAARKKWERLLKRAALRNYSPDHGLVNPLPPMQRLKGLSTLRRYIDKDGNAIPGGEQVLQWEKTVTDAETLERFMQEAISAFSEELPKHDVRTPAPKHCDTDLLTQYTIADYHVGMLACAEECGEDWDIKIAKQLWVDWFDKAVTISPKSETGLLCVLGDFFHWDGLDPVTPTSGHIVDADTRYSKLTFTGIWMIRYAIATLLKRHRHVHVVCCEGNHDISSTKMLVPALAAVYENTARVTIDVSMEIYYAFEFGSTGLFYHHGHKTKPESVDQVFVAKFREIFGRTRHCYGHLGHMHYDKVLETNLMRVQQHRTLAAKDSFSARGGYMSGRDAKVHVYHREFGQVAEYMISPEFVKHF